MFILFLICFYYDFMTVYFYMLFLDLNVSQSPYREQLFTEEYAVLTPSLLTSISTQSKRFEDFCDPYFRQASQILIAVRLSNGKQ